MKQLLSFLLALSVWLPAWSQIPDSCLLLDERMRSHYLWQGDTLLIYASAAQRQHGQPEFVLFPEEIPNWRSWLRELPMDTLVQRYQRKGRLPNPQPVLLRPSMFLESGDPGQPLKGWRIAIDPGHMAGDLRFAKDVEGKAIVMKASAATFGQEIGFFESELTLATAKVLRDSLERLGAVVLLTREKLGVAAHGLSFDAWKAVAFQDSLSSAVRRGDMKPTQAIWWKEQATDGAIFSAYYNRSDLHARVNMIRAFRPDMTLVIHYNVDLDNWMLSEQGKKFVPGLANYSMAFVPGAFLPGELAKVQDRVMLLRLLISPDYEASLRLSEAFIRHSQLHTGVLPVPADAPLDYLVTSSRYTGRPGVFARNLTLTRQLSGPVCYGESLCQDARWEVLRLQQRDLQVGELRVSSRVAEVAAAYLASVREFAQTSKLE